MRKKLLLTLVTVVTVQLIFVGGVFAEYDSSNDITLSVNLLEDEIETSDSTGDATFELQEDAHETLTDTTGQEVDHSYVWIEVNGEKVLAVDPPRPCFN